MAESLVVSVTEAAKMLGLSENAIYRLLDEGQLPEMPRYTRRRTIPRKAIEQVVEHAMAGFDTGPILRELLKEAS